MANATIPAAKTAGGANKMLMGLAVLMLIVGYAAGSMMAGSKGGTSLIGGKSCGTETAVKEELTKKLTDAGLLPPVMPAMNLSGTAKGVDGKVLTIEVGNLNRNPLLAETPKTRKVTVDEKTTIKMLKPIKPEEFQKAQEAFMKKQTAYMAAITKGEAMTPPNPPMSFTEVELKLADIKDGMTINVTAATDVREAAAFTATSIQVSEANAIGAPMPGGIAPPPAPPMPSTSTIAPPPPAPTAPGSVPKPTTSTIPPPAPVPAP